MQDAERIERQALDQRGQEEARGRIGEAHVPVEEEVVVEGTVGSGSELLERNVHLRPGIAPGAADQRTGGIVEDGLALGGPGEGREEQVQQDRVDEEEEGQGAGRRTGQRGSAPTVHARVQSMAAAKRTRRPRAACHAEHLGAAACSRCVRLSRSRVVAVGAF